ncbi:MAG: hypothetical protein KAS32_29190 [Candidatus Peribacteraceae bacterium]|nr:hypothetical protein [Candidatus Peribacteraceae bacterium]
MVMDKLRQAEHDLKLEKLLHSHLKYAAKKAIENPNKLNLYNLKQSLEDLKETEEMKGVQNILFGKDLC